ncbi:MAG: hypothetical protein ACOY3V_07190 [Pseudomonadota bacterium]
MKDNLSSIKLGLALVLLGLLFGVGLGMSFGANEAMFEHYIEQGIAAHPEVHDAKSPEKIWRYAQRAHFHATGIAAFALGLLLLVAFPSLKDKLKKVSAALIGLSSLYPLAWFSMFLLAPSIGRDAAHEHILTELFVMISVPGLLLGLGILLANIFFGFGRESHG